MSLVVENAECGMVENRRVVARLGTWFVWATFVELGGANNVGLLTCVKLLAAVSSWRRT